MSPLNESLIAPPTCTGLLSSLVPNFTFILLSPLLPSLVPSLVQVDISFLLEKFEHSFFQCLQMISSNKIFILWRKRECSNLYFVDLRDDTNEKQLKAYANRLQIKVYSSTISYT